MPRSFTPKSVEHLRSLGYVCESTEYHAGGKSHDLLGWVDCIAFKPGEVLLVQVTSKNNMSTRRRKILEADNYAQVAESGARVTIHGWHQPNGPRTRWVLTEKEIA